MLYYVQLVSLEEGRRIFQASSSVPRKSNEKILDLSSLFFPSARGGGTIQIKSWRLVLRRVNSLIWMDGQLADFSAVWNSNRFFFLLLSRVIFGAGGIACPTSRSAVLLSRYYVTPDNVPYARTCTHSSPIFCWLPSLGDTFWLCNDRMYLLLTTFESSLSSPVSASLY